MNPAPEALRGLRVLVVEDEALIAEELRERLAQRGLCPIDVVDTGERAIRSAQRHLPELVLMDIRLKGPLDGIAAAAEIRRSVGAPVVFLTAHADEDTLRRAKESDPFGYVLKPFSERELLVAIEVSLHRHGMERRLRESEQRYAATLASIGDGVIAVDPAGRVTFMNRVAEALTQWRLDEARGREIDEVFPVVVEATGGARENPALEALRERRVVTLSQPVLLISREGEVIPIDDTAAPIGDGAGRAHGAVVAFHDIRQRRLAEDALRRAEEQLRQSQKLEAIGRLAGGVAHDFNNLLTAINGFTDLLLTGDGLDDASRAMLEEVGRAGERAAGLTRQLLAFSRKQVLQPAIVDLGELVREASRMLERLIGEDVELAVDSVPDLWKVRADPGQIEQVVLNLAVNARDAMPRGGRLAIETRNVDLGGELLEERPEVVPGPFVLLAVEDTGSGMDAPTRERAFEPYFTTKEPGKGTGLGLATVYGIVKQSGGFIYVYSEPGEGTVVKVYFPAVAVDGPGSASRGRSATEPLRGSETVLVVEDDAAVLSLVSAALRRQGYTVHEASGGEEALRCFAEQPEAIDLLLTDAVMPGMSGREVAERIAAIKPSVRVPFASGYTDDAVMRHGVLRGEVAFLQKPFTLEALAGKVRELLDRE